VVRAIQRSDTFDFIEIKKYSWTKILSSVHSNQIYEIRIATGNAEIRGDLLEFLGKHQKTRNKINKRKIHYH